MLRKPIKRPHCHTFNFSPLLHVQGDDVAILEALLMRQRGSVVFENLRAWRLRADKRTADARYNPWAIEVPLGAFSTFSPDLLSPAVDAAGQQRFFAQMSAYRRSYLLNPTGPTSPGFSLTRDILVRGGVSYYREAALSEMRLYGQYPQLFRALYSFLCDAREHPELITGRAYVAGGRLPHPRKFTPFDQRKDVNGRLGRGPNWTQEENDLIRLHFARGGLFSPAQFDVQERQRILKGLPPRDKAATIARWHEDLLVMLKRERTLRSIQQHISNLNGETRRKYAVNGRVPRANRKAFKAEYLGIFAQGIYRKDKNPPLWLLFLRAADSDVIKIEATKIPLLCAGSLDSVSLKPIQVLAFRLVSKEEAEELRNSLTAAHARNSWYTATPEVLAAVSAAQQAALAAFAEGDDAYLTEAQRLRKRLVWDLLKALPEVA